VLLILLLVVEIADVYELFEKPLHPYTKGLLSAVPNPLKRVKEIKSIPGFVPDLINIPKGCRFRPRCNYAFNKCFEEPPLTEVEKGHWVACWLYARR
jgi:peptide/nickel transport system ATP-binding protein